MGAGGGGCAGGRRRCRSVRGVLRNGGGVPHCDLMGLRGVVGAGGGRCGGVGGLRGGRCGLLGAIVGGMGVIVGGVGVIVGCLGVIGGCLRSLGAALGHCVLLGVIMGCLGVVGGCFEVLWAAWRVIGGCLESLGAALRCWGAVFGAAGSPAVCRPTRWVLWDDPYAVPTSPRSAAQQWVRWVLGALGVSRRVPSSQVCTHRLSRAALGSSEGSGLCCEGRQRAQQCGVLLGRCMAGSHLLCLEEMEMRAQPWWAVRIFLPAPGAAPWVKPGLEELSVGAFGGSFAVGGMCSVHSVHLHHHVTTVRVSVVH